MRLILLFLSLTTLGGCNLTSGTSINIDATIIDIAGSTITIEHTPSPTSAPVREVFSIDPNLARRVSVGEQINANVIIGENPQVIGFANRATTEN